MLVGFVNNGKHLGGGGGGGAHAHMHTLRVSSGTSLNKAIRDRAAIETAFSCDFLYNARSCSNSSVISYIPKIKKDIDNSREWMKD